MPLHNDKSSNLISNSSSSNNFQYTSENRSMIPSTQTNINKLYSFSDVRSTVQSSSDSVFSSLQNAVSEDVSLDLGTITKKTSKTVRICDNEVSNGFVKDGSSLTYIFETNESGNRKRYSKILPVCGMCGKKFVCVTTMKRHLVTHTGEKPFSCKVCGKQYTQKGNLRVHERTHRNDRPFECNICSQKFYRKEPMQKHQWRQHGIVHFKSRPNNGNNNINNNNSQPSLGIIGAEGILYSSLSKRMNKGRATEVEYYDIPVSYSLEASAEAFEVEAIVDADDQAEVYLEDDQSLPEIDTEVPEALEETVVHTTMNTELEDKYRPIKLKMKLAQAYMREVEEIREREEYIDRERDGRDWSGFSTTSLDRIDCNLSDIRLSSSDSNYNSNPDRNPSSRPESRLPSLPAESRSLESVFESRPIERQREIQQLNMKNQQVHQETHHMEKESLEFLCKTCSTRCLVSDPYSFRCQSCNTKYTSVPTHLIADPLQCIGCIEIFPHKPALRLHQTSEDKERPFKCCKCGFEFRQKAHLQKHQWRIHRKKFEADTGIKEAETLISVVDNLSSVQSKVQSNHEVECKPEQNPELPHLRRVESESAPLDLSPVKMYGTAGSITKWVEQVETARTPIIPDISIHKKQFSQVETMSCFKALLNGPTIPKNDQVQPNLVYSLSRRRNETHTIRLLESVEKSRTQLYAVKSKLFPVNESWKNPGEQEKCENLLLNQAHPEEETKVTSPSLSAMYISRASKRPRTDLQDVSSNVTSKPDISDLRTVCTSGREHTPLEFILKTPLTLNTVPLKLETHYSTLSPPLNLSYAPQVSPFDYRIGKSNLISGHFQRLKSEDERSGI